MMPGGTPKKTAQVDESLRRPRKRPGHSKLSGEATGTRPRFLKASHWPMLVSRFFGTSDTSMSSMCAMHALSDVSLRSSTEANVPHPFRTIRRASPSYDCERIQDVAIVSGIRRRDDRYIA